MPDAKPNFGGMTARDFLQNEKWAAGIDWVLSHVPLQENRVAILTYLIRRRSGSKPLKESSLRSAAGVLAYFAEFLGSTAFAAATPQQLEAYLAQSSFTRHVANEVWGKRREFDRVVSVKDATRWIWKVTIRTFYRTMHGKEKAAILFGNVRIGAHPASPVKRSDLITSEELDRVVAKLSKPCDRALLLLLAETGFRAGELCALNLSSITFQDDGPAIVTIPSDAPDLKTGARSVPVLHCVPALKAWLEQHPQRGNPTAPLFPNTRRKPGTRLNHGQLDGLVRTWFKGVERHVWPHLLRHTRNTQLAREGLNDSLMRLYSGWSPTSPMPSLYSHLAGQDLDEALYKYWNHPNTPTADDLGIQPRRCPKCKETNLPNAVYCQSCGQELNRPAEHILPAGPLDELLDLVLPEAHRLASALKEFQASDTKA